VVDIIVSLSAATICFLGQCHPVLVGNKTPLGDFPVVHMVTQQAGYGGDILAFAEDKHQIYAVHRIWTLNPKQQRIERIQSNNVKERQGITGGCVNVMPQVYDELLDCCSKGTLHIVP